MDLKDFIEQTISAITDASANLQEKYEKDGVIINPPSAQSGADVFQSNSSNYTMRRVQNIEFDVAITANSETGKSGKAGIKVWSAELGGEVSNANSSSNVSRVSFRVPITLKPSKQEAENREIGVTNQKKDDQLLSRKRS